MEPQQNASEEETVEAVQAKESWYVPLTKVTLFSKSLAMILFVVLPVIGFWKGYQYGIEATYTTNSTAQMDVKEEQIEAKTLAEPIEDYSTQLGTVAWATVRSPEKQSTFLYPTFGYQTEVSWEEQPWGQVAEVRYSECADCMFQTQYALTFIPRSNAAYDDCSSERLLSETFVPRQLTNGAIAYSLEGAVPNHYNGGPLTDLCLVTKQQDFQVYASFSPVGELVYDLSEDESVSHSVRELRRLILLGIAEGIEITPAISKTDDSNEDVQHAEPILSDYNPWTYSNSEYGFSIELPDFVKPANVQIEEASGDILVGVSDYDQKVFRISPYTIKSFNENFFLQRHGHGDDVSLSARFKDWPYTYSPWGYFGENDKYVFLLGGGQDCGGDGCILWSLGKDITRTFSVPDGADFTLAGKVPEPSERVEMVQTFSGKDVRFIYPEGTVVLQGEETVSFASA